MDRRDFIKVGGSAVVAPGMYELNRDKDSVGSNRPPGRKWAYVAAPNSEEIVSMVTCHDRVYIATKRGVYILAKFQPNGRQKQ